MTRPGNVTPLHGASQISPEERIKLFDNAFEAATFGVVLVDPSGRIIKGNRSLAAMLGRSVDDLPGIEFKDITHPDDLDADLALFKEILEGRRDGYKLDKRYLKADGSTIEACLTVTAMRRSSGEVVRLLAQVEDVTELRRKDRELAERAAQLELAMEAVRGGFWHMDVATRRFETSDRLSHFIGGQDAARMDLAAYMEKVDPEDHRATDLTPLLEGNVDKAVAEYRLSTTEGWRWMRCDRRLLRDASGQPFRVIGVVIDFTDEHIRREELESDADTDSLTGLFNRRGLRKRFIQLPKSSGCMVLTVDLDGFKEINDQWGHAAGDLVLIETAQRIRAAVRPSDSVCRLGGDEFVVLLEGDGPVAQRVAERIVAELAAPIDLPEGTVLAEGSVGSAWTINPSPTLETMMRRADKCRYEAKGKGKKTAVVCELSD